MDDEIEKTKPNDSWSTKLRCDNTSDLTSLLENHDSDSARCHISALEELQLWGNKFHAKDIAQAIAFGTNIKIFDMGKVSVEGDQTDFGFLADALEGSALLETFAWTDFSVTNRSISLDGVMKALGTLPNLHTAKIEAKRYTSVTLECDSIAPLCQLPALEELQLSGLILSAFQVSLVADAIKKRDKLSILRLNLVSMDDKSASILAEVIGDSNTLKRLDLSGNNIGDEGCTALADGLTKNSSLQSVQLYGNKNIRSKGMAALAKMLEANRNISKFDAPVSEDRENRVKIEVCLSNNRETARPA